MRTVTYEEIRVLAFRKAGYPRDKAAPSDAEDFRDAMMDQLEDVWNREAWPELVMDFVEVTAVDGQFTKDEETYGDVLSLFHTGNPNLTTMAVPVAAWVDGGGIVRVSTTETALFVEYQMPVPDLPEYGDPALATTILPVRFKQPLASLCAADLIEDEDPGKAERLRARAERELVRQASRFSAPWWRKGSV